jgi:hypothetical protein
LSLARFVRGIFISKLSTSETLFMGWSVWLLFPPRQR